MLGLFLKLQVLLMARLAPPAERERGQATSEYALVILGAAMIALLVVAWATAGGGAGKIGRLFDAVLDSVIGKVS